MTQYLPLSADLINLVKSYINADNYAAYLEKVNKLCRSELISEELQNIQTRQICRFKLAHNCAQVLIECGKIVQCDMATLTGVCMNILNNCTYEQLYNTNDATLLYQICAAVNCNLYLNSPYGLNRAGNIMMMLPQMNKEVLSHFSTELQRRLNRQLNVAVHAIIITAYNRMIESENLCRTVPWYVYTDCLENYIYHELNNLRDRLPLSQGVRIGPYAFGIPLPNGPDLVFPELQVAQISFLDRINECMTKYFPISLGVFMIIISYTIVKKLMSEEFPGVDFYRIGVCMYSVGIFIATIFIAIFVFILVCNNPRILGTLRGNILVLFVGLILGWSYKQLYDESTDRSSTR